ncbi:MAG: hypothetical protein ACLQVD_10720 [Capsulimonadaceae bacterium]
MPAVSVIVQLLSRTRTGGVYALLQFPSGPLLPPDTRMVVAQIPGWHSGFVSAVHRDSVIASLAHRPSTDVWVNFDFHERFIESLGGTLTGIRQTMTLSPTNSTWLPTRDWPANRRTEGVAYAKAIEREDWVRRLRQWDLPSYSETVFAFRTERPLDRFLSSFAHALAASIPGSVLDVEPFGAADISPARGGAVHFGKTMAQELAVWPLAIPQLGERIDALHDIIIGSRALSEKIVSACAASSTPCELISLRTDGAYALIRLPSYLSVARSAPPAFQDCLACRTDDMRETPLRPEGIPEQELQGYRVRNSVYYTVRAYRFLCENGRLARNPAMVFERVIARSYCKMLGVDPRMMLVAPRQPEGRRGDRARIKFQYARLSPNLPTPQRIWCAHMNLWRRRYPAPPPEYLDLLTRLYFPTVDPQAPCPQFAEGRKHPFHG